ncbi:hypothetical protein BJP41_08275 [Candidatus Williamhamiltonella defendens]|uniref:Transposase DDE domain-containing protein n=2 Tax=Candidatus Williamhamiltonella defendens TaxID=138072 RepID=A0A2D3T3C2_9ENTR|nr:hypothetical protein BJP41_08275 [Candidatus Hamiltonella defensa]
MKSISKRTFGKLMILIKKDIQTRIAIERFFGKIKENKRLALRFDKLDVTFFSFFSIACLKLFK